MYDTLTTKLDLLSSKMNVLQASLDAAQARDSIHIQTLSDTRDETVALKATIAALTGAIDTSAAEAKVDAILAGLDAARVKVDALGGSAVTPTPNPTPVDQTPVTTPPATTPPVITLPVTTPPVTTPPVTTPSVPATPKSDKEPMTLMVGPNQQFPYLPHAMGQVGDALFNGRRVALDVQFEVTADENYYLNSMSCHLHGGVWPPFDEVVGDFNKIDTCEAHFRRIPGSKGLVVIPYQDASAHLYYGKGALIFTKNVQSIDGFHFKGVKRGDPDGNFAGIRIDDSGTTDPVLGTFVISNCIFEDCDDGLLGGSRGQTLDLHNVWLKDCGSGSGYTHNAYFNHFDLVTATDLLSTGAKVGHLFKCRAAKTVLRRVRLFDGDAGSASYCLDIPNGGILDVDGLVTQKGVNASNAPILSFAAEGAGGGGRNAGDAITIRNWTMINDMPGTNRWGNAIGLWNAGTCTPGIQGTVVWNVDRMNMVGEYGSTSFQPFPDSTVITLAARPDLDMTSPVNMQG